MDPVKVKGKQDPVAVYRVVKPKAINVSDKKIGEVPPLTASDSMRAAKFTVSPITVYCIFSSVPMPPAMTMPVLMPVCKVSGFSN